MKEGTIKNQIKKMLVKYNVYVFMPVQTGYGAAGLDFHCIVLAKNDRPFPFFIEAKKPDATPKPRQQELINKLRKEYNCAVWVIDNDVGVQELDAWLHSVTKQVEKRVTVGK